MKKGDLVKWTFAKTSSTYNPGNLSYFGILLKKGKLPENSWYIMLETRDVVHADITEIDLINECKLS